MSRRVSDGRGVPGIPSGAASERPLEFRGRDCGPAGAGSFHAAGSLRAGYPGSVGSERRPTRTSWTAPPGYAGVSPASIGGGLAVPFAGETPAYPGGAVPRTRRSQEERWASMSGRESVSAKRPCGSRMAALGGLPAVLGSRTGTVSKGANGYGTRWDDHGATSTLANNNQRITSENCEIRGKSCPIADRRGEDGSAMRARAGPASRRGGGPGTAARPPSSPSPGRGGRRRRYPDIVSTLGLSGGPAEAPAGGEAGVPLPSGPAARSPDEAPVDAPSELGRR